MTILTFRCRNKAVMHRLAYCTSCRAMICYQSLPYGNEWSALQKMNWKEDCDEHRTLCDSWIEEHHAKMTAGRDARPAPITPGGSGGSGTTSGPQTCVESKETGIGERWAA